MEAGQASHRDVKGLSGHCCFASTFDPHFPPSGNVQHHFLSFADKNGVTESMSLLTLWNRK